LYLVTFYFEKGKPNTGLSVDKLFQENLIQPLFRDLFPMLALSTERGEKYKRTKLHMVGKRAFRNTSLQFFKLWVRLNKREKEEREPKVFPLPFW
jgi:hypothetical protein